MSRSQPRLFESRLHPKQGSIGLAAWSQPRLFESRLHLPDNGRHYHIGPNHGYLKAACTEHDRDVSAAHGPNHGYLKAACTLFVP